MSFVFKASTIATAIMIAVLFLISVVIPKSAKYAWAAITFLAATYTFREWTA